MILIDKSYKNLSFNHSHERVIKALHIVNVALDAAHQTCKALEKTYKLRQALKTDDYALCLRTAQETLWRYESLINSYSILTSVKVIHLSSQEIYDKDIFYWKTILEFEILIIFIDTAFKFGLKTVLEDSLEKIFSPINVMQNTNINYLISDFL